MTSQNNPISGDQKVKIKKNNVKISSMENAIEEAFKVSSGNVLYCLFSTHKAKKTATKYSTILRK